ncbi:PucR family transcriptional regulator [Amycolatopsis alkalitolerans]|uniref:PucR family transcriptional regulator n=1 Tax=Amycolatopsis alkalitolerans TaxID=2547244 RepID=A0A5C4MC21_9PSEU|nr:helix-turn-helix domain-containing protein [Amycolatopsis alkalitolerans]TNC29692.1 PucR family transcriptional regulator [Amycolatopsis alkalitolerans]
MTLRTLLATPEWAAVRVLAGDPDRPLRTVRATLDLGQVPVADELVVLAGPVSPADWRIDALLRRSADAGGTGLLLPAVEPLTGTRLLADRLGIPLLVSETDPLELLVSARLHLVAPDLDRAQLVLATHRALDDRPHSPDQAVAVLRELLRAPVALLDNQGQPFAGELAEAGLVRAEEPVPQRIDLDDGVLLAHPALHPRPGLWVATALKGIAAARADVVPPALAVAASAVQRWLLANRLELERDARSRTALLTDLLRLDAEPGADLRRRIADAGWRLGGWHIGIRVGASSTVDTVARTHEVVRALGAEDTVIAEHGEGWTGWLTLDQEPTAARVRKLAARLRAAHKALGRTLVTHMGVGRPYPRAEGLATTIAEATDAARLAATRPEAGHFLHVDQLGMAQLLLEWTRTDTFEPAARALVAPLQPAPGDLVRTLAAYLDAESSLAETAAVLGVHRNTVAARIARVEQLLGVDLTRRDERLALHLACRTVTMGD